MYKSIKTNYYTYIIRHTNGRYYVGRRSTKKDPLLDPYMGSGDWVKKIKDKSTLTKTIIACYDTFEELKIGEMELIEKYFDDEYCMNIMYSSCGASSGDKHHNYGKTGELSPNFGKIGELSCWFGKTHTEETKQKISDNHADVSGCKNSCFGRSGDKHPMFNIMHTKESKKMMSDAQSGEKSYRATITDNIARLIKIRIAEGVKNKPISEEHNTTVAVVQGIRSGRSWKHIII